MLLLLAAVLKALGASLYHFQYDNPLHDHAALAVAWPAVLTTPALARHSPAKLLPTAAVAVVSVVTAGPALQLQLHLQQLVFLVASWRLPRTELQPTAVFEGLQHLAAAGLLLLPLPLQYCAAAVGGAGMTVALAAVNCCCLPASANRMTMCCTIIKTLRHTCNTCATYFVLSNCIIILFSGCMA